MSESGCCRSRVSETKFRNGQYANRGLDLENLLHFQQGYRGRLCRSIAAQDQGIRCMTVEVAFHHCSKQFLDDIEHQLLCLAKTRDRSLNAIKDGPTRHPACNIDDCTVQVFFTSTSLVLQVEASC